MISATAVLLLVADLAGAADETQSPPNPEPDTEEATAPAPPAPVEERSRRETSRFGSAGSILVTGDSAIGISRASGRVAEQSLVFSPDVDFFVVRNLSLGLALDVSYSTLERQTSIAGSGPSGEPTLQAVKIETFTFAVAPRVGVVVPLGDLLSFYPRAALGFEHVTRGGGSNNPTIEVSAPLLLHAAPHFFIGAGPTFLHVFGEGRNQSDRDRRTRFGGQLLLGVFWGGSSATDGSGAPSDEAVDEERFGHAGQVAFSTEFGISATRTDYGPRDPFDAVNIVPGVDYFVAPHLSIGATAYYFSAAFSEYTLTRGGGGGPRIGYDVPIAKWLSLNPRFTALYATENMKVSGASTNDTIVTGVLFVPLLVHPASHGFIGFGPYLARDFSRTNDDVSTAPKQTSLGASLVLGGWL